MKLEGTDSYCTPKWLADRLGTFDTDPCSNPRSHIQATTKYSLETHDNGLELPWHGRVWLNHPYSKPLPWMCKLHFERTMGRCTESLCLAKLDTSTVWWATLTAIRYGVCDLWMLHRRVQFDIAPETLDAMRRSRVAKGKPPQMPAQNNFCSVLVHHRAPNTSELDLCDIATKWVRL